MNTRQRYIALFCLLTFGIGSVVAPASHFVYMAISDAYGLMGHSAHTAHDDMGHADMHDTSHVMPLMGAKLAPVDTHALCEYADLFATLLLDVAPEHASVDRFDQPTLLSYTWTAAPPTPTLLTLSARGPPVA